MESLRIRNEAGVMYAAMKVVQCMVGSKDHEVGKSILNSNNYKKGCRNNSVVVDIAGEMGNH